MLSSLYFSNWVFMFCIINTWVSIFHSEDIIICAICFRSRTAVAPLERLKILLQVVFVIIIKRFSPDILYHGQLHCMSNIILFLDFLYYHSACMTLCLTRVTCLLLEHAGSKSPQYKIQWNHSRFEIYMENWGLKRDV